MEKTVNFTKPFSFEKSVSLKIPPRGFRFVWVWILLLLAAAFVCGGCTAPTATVDLIAVGQAGLASAKESQLQNHDDLAFIEYMQKIGNPFTSIAISLALFQIFESQPSIDQIMFIYFSQSFQSPTPELEASKISVVDSLFNDIRDIVKGMDVQGGGIKNRTTTVTGVDYTKNIINDLKI